MGCEVDLTPGGSRRSHSTLWTPAGGSTAGHCCPSKLPFDSLISVKGISTCALPFLSLSYKIKTGRDPRGAELEEEAQRGEVGTAWEWRTQNRRG